MEIDREEILNVFSAEAEEQLDVLEDGLLKLEQSPKDPETLEILFRAAHSLKGNARVVQLTAVEAFTHTLEDVLERVKDGALPATAGLISQLLGAVDGLRRVIPLALEGSEAPQPEHAALIRWLATHEAAPQTLNAPSAADTLSSPEATVRPRSGESRTLRVDVRKLDRMLNLVGEITIARGRLGALLAAGGSSNADLRGAHEETDRLFLELQEELMRSRMVPLGPAFRRYFRMVRDLALERGKDVQLVLEGEDVEVDTAVVEGLQDPLTHMLRNAVDHGLEKPVARRAQGKPERGTICLRARREAGNLVVSLSDDGAGLDRDRILEKGRQLGLFGPDQPPNDGALFGAIFEPGFSTAPTVTEVSGRGIGMNVVRKNVEALRGTVRVESEAGHGTTFTLRVPLTLAIIEGFSVGVGEESYVLPLDAVVECVDLPEQERQSGRAQGILDLRGQPLPYVRLGKLFQLPEAGACPRESVVVLQHQGSRAGLAVDELRGAGQAVIKPLAPLVDRVPTVAGCTLLGTGRVALILDVPALFRAAVEGAAAASSGASP